MSSCLACEVVATTKGFQSGGFCFFVKKRFLEVFAVFFEKLPKKFLDGFCWVSVEFVGFFSVNPPSWGLRRLDNEPFTRERRKFRIRFVEFEEEHSIFKTRKSLEKKRNIYKL